MSGLRDFLYNQDAGVRSTGDALHIAVSLLETIVTAVEGLHVVVPTLSTTAIPAVGFATVGGVTSTFGVS